MTGEAGRFYHQHVAVEFVNEFRHEYTDSIWLG